MKILYCIPALHNTGGMERVLSIKANYLAALPNYEIFIVTTDHLPNQPIRYELDSNIHLIHLAVDFEAHFEASLVSKTSSHYRKLNAYKKHLKRIISENKIDICVSLCGKEVDFLGELDVNCIKVGEIHFALNNRLQFLQARKDGLLWRIIGKIRTIQLIRAVKKLDAFVVLTKEDERLWHEHCTHVFRIPNPSSVRSDVLCELSSKKAIAVGRLSPQKGFDMLINAWAKVHSIYPDWELNIFGEGELRDQLEAQISALQLQQHVFLHGNVSNIHDKYLESSIFVLSSVYEGLPMAMIEAMAYGMPMVAFDCEYGPRELISDNVNGFLVTPKDVNELANKISLLITNQVLRQKMGEQSAVQSARYSVNIIMNEWVELFEKLYIQHN